MIRGDAPLARHFACLLLHVHVWDARCCVHACKNALSAHVFAHMHVCKVEV